MTDSVEKGSGDGCRKKSYLHEKNAATLLRLLAGDGDTPVFVMSVDDIVDVVNSERFRDAYSVLHWLVVTVNRGCLHSADVRISLDPVERLFGSKENVYRFVADCEDHIVTSKRTFDL